MSKIMYMDNEYAGALAFLDVFYPVASYYETSDASFDPNITWGGNWASETIKDDVIVEEGVSGIWTYRKWKSGIAECWGESAESALNYVSWGSIYEAAVGPNHSFPSGLFVAKPVISVVAVPVYGNAVMSTEIGGGGADKDYVYGIYATRPAVPSSSAASAHIIAKGRWKTYSAPTTRYRWHRTA